MDIIHPRSCLQKLELKLLVINRVFVITTIEKLTEKKNCVSFDVGNEAMVKILIRN